jgi:hypothetical protein
MLTGQGYPGKPRNLRARTLTTSTGPATRLVHAPGTFLGGSIIVQFDEPASVLAAGADRTLNVHCPAGQTGVGGGILGDTEDSEDTTVNGTRPAKSPTDSGPPVDDQSFTGWRGTVTHNAGSAATGVRPRVCVICAATP